MIDHHGMRDVGRGTLKSIFNRIIQEYAKECGRKAVPQYSINVEDENVSKNGIISSHLVQEVMATVAREASSLSIDDEAGCHLTGLAQGSTEKLRPLIDAVHKLQTVFDKNVGVLVLGSNDHVLRFRIDTSFLDEETARIWGVQYGIPIIIEFSFLSPYFLESSKVRPGMELVLIISASRGRCVPVHCKGP